MYLDTDQNINDMLLGSNEIEGVYDEKALKDALNAWTFAYTIFESTKMVTIAMLLDTHGILMRNIDRAIAGKERTCKVWIGGRECKAETKKSWHNKMGRYLQLWNAINMCYTNSELRKIIEDENKKNGKGIVDIIRGQHVAFEMLHPFVDGNGRIGRILYNLQRNACGLPVHILTASDRPWYYSWFKS